MSLRRELVKKKQMNLYLLSQVIACVFGFITLGGLLWFAGSHSMVVLTAGLLLGFSSVAVAFFPRRKLSNSIARGTLVTLCVVGACAGLVLTSNDLTASYGTEWDVVAMRLLPVAALAIIGIKTLDRSPNST